MADGIKTIIYPVSDLAKSKAMFTELLGTEPAQDSSYYVGFSVGGQDIGLDPGGHAKGMTGPACYTHVDDIEAAFQALLDAGAEENQKITGVGAGRRIASVKDQDGNVIGLLQDAKEG